MKRWWIGFLVLGALAGGRGAWGQTALGQAAGPTGGAAGAVADASLSQGLDALKANQPQQALEDFQKALAAAPGNATANLLASTAAMELYQGKLAVEYAEKARQLDPQDWKIHTTLVAAYAEAGMKAQRDQERTLLRQMHQNGPPDAREATGFLLEMLPVNAWRVDAVEYFEPMGKFHTCYRFLVRRADGTKVGEIDVQSDDFDERSWERAHAAEAAAGGRQFQLNGYGAAGEEADYRTFSGKPDYDAFRQMAVFFLEKQGLPGTK
ncbi:MAG TPA: hypothetical protein VHX37_10780 [Acidobacteriaceae bacterium]|jgi:tetratricopeptide (TPR) repeat protein|nr:hypothetical protein [Acidobacteriaceae bacterium]